MATLYNVGQITIAQNSTKVYGTDTAWLLGGVKVKDLIFLGGTPYEIAEVNNSTEITLTYSYNGDNITSGGYVIQKIARHILTVELSEEIQALIDAVNKRDAEMADAVEYAESIKKAGIRVDANKNIYQTEPEAEPITDDDIATDDEIDSLIDNVYNN